MGDVVSPTVSEAASPSQQGPTALAISVNRVKNLLKDDAEIKSISTEACFAVAKATELFVERLAARAADRMAAAGRPASLEYGDVAAVVAEEEPLDFLSEVIPQTVKAAGLLAKM